MTSPTDLRPAADADGVTGIGDAVAAAVRSLQADDPLAEVVVITPRGPTAQTLRRVLPRSGTRGGVVGIRFDTPVELAAEIVRSVDGPAPRVSPLALSAAVQHQLDTACPDALQGVRDNPTTIESIVGVADRVRLLPAAENPAWFQPTSAGRLALFTVARRSLAQLRSLGYRDERSIIDRACELVTDRDTVLPERVVPERVVPERVVVVASDCFHPAHVELLRHVLDRLGDRGRVVALPTIEGDVDLIAQIARLGGSPQMVGRSVALGRTPTLVSCPDHDEEVRHTLRSIASMLRDRATSGPVELDDISILYPPGTGYHRAIVDELDRARIPWVGTAPQLLRESLGGTILRLALSAALDPSRVNVIELATLAPFAPARGAPRRTPAHWRKLARRLELTNAGSWQRAREVAAAAAEGATVADAGGRDLADRDVEALGRLIEFVDRTTAVGDALRARSTDWSHAADQLVDFMSFLTGDVGQGLWSRAENWQLRAVEQIAGGLALLGTLSGEALGDLTLEYSVADLQRMIEQLLDQPVRRVNTNGTGIRVRPVSDGVCLDDRHVFVVGANDQVLPPSRSDDLFAPSPGEPEAAYVEHVYWRQRQVERAWYRLIGGDAAVTVSWSRADLRRGGATFPSRLVDDLVDGSPEVSAHQVQAHQNELIDGPSLSLADEMVKASSTWHGNEVLRRRVESQIGRSGSELTEYDGAVGPGVVPLAETTLAVTHLEGLAQCGLKYLYRQVLGVYEDDDPVDSPSISALNRGNLLHNTLESIVDDWLALPEPRPAWLGDGHLAAVVGAPGDRPATRRDLVESTLAPHEATLKQTGALGHPARWKIERELLIDGILGVLADDDTTGATPVAAEHAFGFNSAGTSPFAYSAPSHDVQFRGKIDRVDLLPDGGTRVTDYKTTSAVRFPTIKSADPTEGGTKLQLPLYARVAARDFSAGQADSHPPRYLYVRGDEVSPQGAPDVADEHLDHYLDIWIDRVAAGDFHPGAPDEMWGCAYCSPDGLGLDAVAERVRRLALAVPGPGDTAEDIAGDAVDDPVDEIGDGTRGGLPEADVVDGLDIAPPSHPTVLAPSGIPGERADDADRAKIIGEIGQPFVVVAGAGSGKTTVLVERVSNEIAANPQIVSRMVIITFTEKAARELTHRLRAACPGVDFDEAYVGTIHGFCSSILRRYPIEAGLPTRFEAVGDLASATDAAERADSQIARLFDSIADDDADPALIEAIVTIASVHALKHLPTLATVLDQKWDQIDATALRPPLTTSDVKRALDTITAPVRAIANSDPMTASPDDKLVAYVRDDLIPWVDALPTGLRPLARATCKRPGGIGSNKVWGSAKEIRDTIVDTIDAVRGLAIDEALRRVLAALIPIVRSDAEQRIANGMVTYDDLLILTRRLLGDPDQRGVLDELRSNVRQLYVDEFQDTDDVQFDIIADLCGQPRVDGTTAVSTDQPPATLVLVGDPKQAIYGFRDANPTLLTEQAKTVGEQINLVTNFRSQPDVCSWINAIMSTRFVSTATDREDQVPYQDLQAFRSQVPDAAPSVALIGFEHPDAPEPQVLETAAEVGYAEGSDIAATVAAMLDRDRASQPWRVGDDGEHPRPSDIAILIRGRGALAPIETALRAASIPYRVEGGTLLYESREVYELLRVLTAIEHLNDDRAVVTALRTSIFGLTDPQLVAFRRAFHYWNAPTAARVEQVEADGVDITLARPVIEALVSLQRWSMLRTTLNPAQLLAAIYDSTFGAAAARHAERDAAVETWRRVRFVIDEARAWVDEYAGTLGEYLDWVAARVDRVDRSEMSTGENEDAVRIMTIHAAKGLEFPIVFVAGLGRGDPNESGVRVVSSTDGIEVAFSAAVRTLDFPAADADAAEREEARLLYVAFTRAMDHLVISGYTSKNTHRSAIRRLGEAIRSVPTPIIHTPTVTTAPHEILDAADGSDPSAELGADRDPVEFVPLAANPRRTIWTPSALAHSWAGDDASQPTPDDAGAVDGERPTPTLAEWAIYAHDPSDPGLRKDPGSGVIAERTKGRYGTAIGTAVHEVLQMVDLSAPKQHLDTLVREAAANADVADIETITTLATSIIDSDLFAELAASRSTRREVYVGATLGDTDPDDKVVVWGYIDALFERGDGLVVVDFKTDSATATEGTLVDRYRAQLSGYARAAQQATGRDVEAAYLLVARRDGKPANAIEVPDLLSADELVPAETARSTQTRT